MSRGERRKDKRAESPMQKRDVVVRASRLLVWDRRPRSCPCGTGALAGHSATFGPGRYPGPHLRNLRLGHNSPLQRQRRDTYQPLQRQRRDTYQPWLKAKETGPPKILTGLKARNITSCGRSIPNMFRAFSPLACFESHHLALQARLVCYAPSALRRSHAAAVGALGDACRWPLAGLSDHGKEMTPLGAPSASSAFLCRLPRRRSGHPMFRALGAEEG